MISLLLDGLGRQEADSLHHYRRHPFYRRGKAVEIEFGGVNLGTTTASSSSNYGWDSEERQVEFAAEVVVVAGIAVEAVVAGIVLIGSVAAELVALDCADFEVSEYFHMDPAQNAAAALAH